MGDKPVTPEGHPQKSGEKISNKWEWEIRSLSMETSTKTSGRDKPNLLSSVPKKKHEDKWGGEGAEERKEKLETSRETNPKSSVSKVAQLKTTN